VFGLMFSCVPSGWSEAHRRSSPPPKMRLANKEIQFKVNLKNGAEALGQITVETLCKGFYSAGS
jgi:hypothetical protein